jgi:hypothetical protein
VLAGWGLQQVMRLQGGGRAGGDSLADIRRSERKGDLRRIAPAGV